MKQKPIILVAGGTGVGTSRIASRLANCMGIYSVISTDSIREILRSAIAEGINPVLHDSTYLAGQSENYRQKSAAIKREKILRGFKTQARSVDVGIEGLIRRHAKENSSVIMEGVHIIPRNYTPPISGRTMQYFIHIADEDIHKDRLRLRSKEAPARKVKIYLENFREIRWIQEYLLRKARAASDVVIINNEGPLDDSVEACVQEYWKRFPA